MDTDSKLDTAKSITKFVVGHCTKAVIATAITSLVPVETKTQKVQVYVGTYALSGMVAEKAKTYVSDRFDFYVDAVREIKNGKKDSETPTE